MYNQAPEQLEENITDYLSSLGKEGLSRHKKQKKKHRMKRLIEYVLLFLVFSLFPGLILLAG